MTKSEFETAERKLQLLTTLSITASFVVFAIVAQRLLAIDQILAIQFGIFGWPVFVIIVLMVVERKEKNMKAKTNQSADEAAIDYQI